MYQQRSEVYKFIEELLDMEVKYKGLFEESIKIIWNKKYAVTGAAFNLDNKDKDVRKNYLIEDLQNFYINSNVVDKLIVKKMKK